MTHPLFLFVCSLLFKAPEFLESFCIYVFHFLLCFIREITEEVDAGFVFQRLDVYDIVAELVAFFKCLVLVREPVAESAVCILVGDLVQLLFQYSYKEKLWYWDIAWLLGFARSTLLLPAQEITLVAYRVDSSTLYDDRVSELIFGALVRRSFSISYQVPCWLKSLYWGCMLVI